MTTAPSARATWIPGDEPEMLSFTACTSDVEIAMQRQDEAGVVGEHQTLRRDEHALTAQALDFLGERPGIDDHAIADDGELALDKA